MLDKITVAKWNGFVSVILPESKRLCPLFRLLVLHVTFEEKMRRPICCS